MHKLVLMPVGWYSWRLVYWPVALAVGSLLLWWTGQQGPGSWLRGWAIVWPWLIAGWWVLVALPAAGLGRGRKWTPVDAVLLVATIFAGTGLTAQARLAPNAAETGVGFSDQYDLYDVLGENHEFHQHYEWMPAPGLPVEIRNHYGAVRVLPSTDDRIRLDVYEAVRGPKLEEARSRADALVFSAGEFDGSYLIRSNQSGLENPTMYRTHLDVRVPPAAPLVVVDNRGAIEVDGMAGSQTVYGRDGGILLRPERGPLEVHALRGDVRVVFSDPPEEPAWLTTEGGNLRVQLPEDAALEVRGRVESGTFVSDFPRMTATPADGELAVMGRVGTPDVRMDFDVIDGTMELERNRSGVRRSGARR